MNEMRAEVWKILTEVHGCKRDGEDCTHKKCNRYFTCEALITALLPQATEEVKEISLCPHCYCMTKNICGKCKKIKESDL